MNSGVAGGGKLDVQAFQNQLVFSKEVGTVFGKDFDAAASQNDLWTNSFVERAGQEIRSAMQAGCRETTQPVGVNRAIRS